MPVCIKNSSTLVVAWRAVNIALVKERPERRKTGSHFVCILLFHPQFDTTESHKQESLLFNVLNPVESV